MKYFEKAATNYQKRSERGIWQLWRKQELKAVVELLQMFAGCHLFEVGTGAGYYLRFFRDAGFKNLSGCDQSDAMASVCRRDGLNVVSGDFHLQVLNPNTNRILAAGVLEFIPNCSQFFIWAKKNSKDGTLLVVLLPSFNWRGRLYQLFHRFNGNSIYIRDPGEVKKIAGAAGWEYIRQLPGSPVSTVICFRRREN